MPARAPGAKTKARAANAPPPGVRLTRATLRGYQCGVHTEAKVPGNHVVPLVGLGAGLPLLLLDAWFLNLGSGGRAGFVAALGTPGAEHLVVGAALLALLLVHGLLGFAAARRAPRGDAGAFGHPGHRVLQWSAAAVGLAFLLLHVLRHSPVGAALEGLSAAALYERMRHELSRPVFVGVYVVGLGSLCLHAFQGLAACIQRFGGAMRDQLRRFSVFLALLVCIGLFAVLLDGLSHYVAGKALVARPTRAEQGGPHSIAP